MAENNGRSDFQPVAVAGHAFQTEEFSDVQVRLQDQTPESENAAAPQTHDQQTHHPDEDQSPWNDEGQYKYYGEEDDHGERITLSRPLTAIEKDFLELEEHLQDFITRSLEPQHSPESLRCLMTSGSGYPAFMRFSAAEAKFLSYSPGYQREVWNSRFWDWQYFCRVSDPTTFFATGGDQPDVVSIYNRKDFFGKGGHKSYVERKGRLMSRSSRRNFQEITLEDLESPERTASLSSTSGGFTSSSGGFTTTTDSSPARTPSPLEDNSLTTILGGGNVWEECEQDLLEEYEVQKSSSTSSSPAVECREAQEESVIHSPQPISPASQTAYSLKVGERDEPESYLEKARQALFTTASHSSEQRCLEDCNSTGYQGQHDDSASQSYIDELHRQATELREELNKFRRERDDALAETEGWREKHQQLSDQHVEQAEQLSKAQSIAADVEESKAKLELSFQEKDCEIHALRIRTEEQQSQIKDLRDQVNELGAVKAKVDSKLAHEKHETARLQSANKAQQAWIDAERQNCDWLKDRLEGSSEGNGALQVQVEEFRATLQVERESHESIVTSLREDNQAQMARIERLRRELVRERVQARNLQDRLDESVGNAKIERDDFHSTIDRLEVQLAAYARQMKSVHDIFQETIADLRAESDEHKADIERRQEAAAAVEAELSATQEQNQLLGIHLDESLKLSKDCKTRGTRRRLLRTGTRRFAKLAGKMVLHGLQELCPLRNLSPV